ncbi:MAG: dTMP kinase [Hellea sp.]|nr:dTMP kinase [Hellea sp.]
MHGKLITFEGGEGAGKSTQADRLAKFLNKAGIETLLTREPGGTFGAEAIRDLVLSGTQDRWSGLTELLLMYAARLDHVEKLIKPAIERGVWVISDRFADSSMAYQGHARGLGKERVEAVHKAVFDDFEPDITILFDMDPVMAMKRVETRGEKISRFDAESIEFHKELREAFKKIASDNPDRIHTINADASIESVETQILFAITQKYPELAAQLTRAD